MKLVLPAFALAILIGYLRGGRLASLADLPLRWQGVALLGLLLQVVLWPGGEWPLLYLYVSFALLTAFAIVNIRVTGVVLILIGIALNFTVIAVNRGMPVSREAIVASHQADSLGELVDDGGAKHHLASSADHLRFLGDVIPLPALDQAISVGDVFTYGGVIVLLVAGMGRRRRADEPRDLVGEVAGRVDG
jgi:Family of unknown function (DUF5317)